MTFRRMMLFSEKSLLNGKVCTLRFFDLSVQGVKLRLGLFTQWASENGAGLMGSKYTAVSSL